MFADLKAVMWKECLEFGANSDRRQTFLKLLFFIVIATIFLPMPIEDEEQRNAAWLQLWYLMPTVMTMSVIPDAIAGERERHTLETLLASRLSDRAIALAKMTVAVIYAWSLTILLSLSLLIKINLSDRSRELEFYSSDFFLSGAIGSLLLSILVANIGVLAALKAETIKQAYKRVTTAVMLVILLPSIILFAIILFFPPSMGQGIVGQLVQTGCVAIAVRMLILAIVDAFLIALVLKLFERTRLMSS